ncbi:uncharacterized protein [Argopecten irradians]|uniref:uncharacterized protein isoform X2 n=1 Tax=Argopecten irradians TaxID=31199 RepID=UPI0037151185
MYTNRVPPRAQSSSEESSEKVELDLICSELHALKPHVPACLKTMSCTNVPSELAALYTAIKPILDFYKNECDAPSPPPPTTTSAPPAPTPVSKREMDFERLLKHILRSLE